MELKPTNSDPRVSRSGSRSAGLDRRVVSDDDDDNTDEESGNELLDGLPVLDGYKCTFTASCQCKSQIQIHQSSTFEGSVHR